MEGFFTIISCLIFGAIVLVFAVERIDQKRMNKERDAAAQRRHQFETGKRNSN